MIISLIYTYPQSRFQKRDFKQKRPNEWREDHNKRFKTDPDSGLTIPVAMENKVSLRGYISLILHRHRTGPSDEGSPLLS